MSFSGLRFRDSLLWCAGIELCLNAHALRRHLFDEGGQLRSFVNVYKNDEDVRYLDNGATRVSEGDALSIIPSIAGGATPTAAVERASS